MEKRSWFLEEWAGAGRENVHSEGSEIANVHSSFASVCEYLAIHGA